ncbi:hypothetical protein M5D96_002547 [Drosophila gunungcola]|uniref:Uncharacterized protein n=1 Tax=Drosophila gunungcola TaxID=103775 RepID=A0A9P9Z053_9MUSC|nr:hypothetical protein M5D96_002547 [Drosophila gunungcola]
MLLHSQLRASTQYFPAVCASCTPLHLKPTTGHRPVESVSMYPRQSRRLPDAASSMTTAHKTNPQETGNRSTFE